MPIYLLDRQARQNHVAKAPAATLFRRMIYGDAGHGNELRQQRRKNRELILASGTRQSRIGKVVGDLLYAEDVEISEAPCLGDDPRWIDAAIDTATPLDVPGD